jgi:hypothetical protein
MTTKSARCTVCGLVARDREPYPPICEKRNGDHLFVAIPTVAQALGEIEITPPPPPPPSVAQVLGEVDGNWEKGIPLSRFLHSCESHLGKFKDGDRKEDHLAAVLWNMYGYVWTEREIREGRLPKTLRDVPWADSVPFERQVEP